MKKLLLIPVVAAAVLLAGSPASAGGWAVSTLDELPTPIGGEEVAVGFTIRQHGETPVDVEGDVGITVKPSGGKSTFFPAKQDGPTGHYVATVHFPVAATYTWSVEQGWFGSQTLGAIEVPPKRGTAPAPPTKTPAPAPVTVRHEPVQLPLAVRLLLPTVALAAGGLALADVLHARRVKRQQLAAA